MELEDGEIVSNRGEVRLFLQIMRPITKGLAIIRGQSVLSPMGHLTVDGEATYREAINGNGELHKEWMLRTKADKGM